MMFSPPRTGPGDYAGGPVAHAMAWSTATIRLDRPRCDAARALGPDQRLRCVTRSDGGPLAHLSDGELDSWGEVRPCRQGQFVKRDHACRECPARMLPSDMVPTQVDVALGNVTLQVVFPRPASLSEAYHGLRMDGQAPHITRRRDGPAPAPAALVDLGALTRRQREALETARRIGYFEEGNAVGVDDLAGAMGCSRSTAHEHLRRGMARLLDAVLG